MKLATLVLLGAFVFHPAFAYKKGTISDETGFFSKEAVDRAAELNKEIKKLYKKEVIIETLTKIPMTNEHSVLNGKTPDPLFSEWAKKRMEKLGKKNIYVAIAKDPSFLMVSMGTETRQKGEFTENDRNLLIKVFADNFKVRAFDRALLDAMRFIKLAIEGNLKGTPLVLQAPPQPKTDPNADVAFLWRWLGFGCAALLGLLLVTGLLKGAAPKVKSAADELVETARPTEQTPA